MGELSRPTDLPPIPWMDIIKSGPMYALAAAHIGHDWGFFVLNTDLPKYLNDVVNLGIEENGLYSALPYLVMWIVAVSFGKICDIMINKQCISVTNARKLFTFNGMYETEEKIIYKIYKHLKLEITKIGDYCFEIITFNTTAYFVIFSNF